MPRKPPPNKHNWSLDEINFIKDFFGALTNKELADALGLKITMLRMKCYDLGLKRMELEYWTDEQTKYLKANYKKIGDKELAEIFNNKWSKAKGWTHKHIEKKRKYLKLHRTKKQIAAIRQRNVDNGRFAMCPVKAWKVRGVAPNGTIRYWRKWDSKDTFPVIKVNGKFVHWGRWAWKQKYGKVPAGMNVVFKDGNQRNLSVDNLELLTDAQLSFRNSLKSSKGLSDNYIACILSHKNPGIREELLKDKKLLEIKRLQLLLNRTIKSKSDGK